MRAAQPVAGELPPLPEPDVIACACIGENDAYSEMRMREFGRQCRAARPANGAQAGDADKLDAERYRFARDNGYFSAPLVEADITYTRATDIDFGIDALLAAAKKST